MQTPDELLDIESQLRSLRLNTPQVIVLSPRTSRAGGYVAGGYVAGLCLLVGLVVGGVTVDQFRPVPAPVEIVRIVEVPIEVTPQAAETQVATHRHPRESEEPDDRLVSLDSRLRGNDAKNLNLDAMFEEYNRRAKLFAKIDWVASASRPSYGSISDPMSAFRLRQTLDL